MSLLQSFCRLDAMAVCASDYALIDFGLSCCLALSGTDIHCLISVDMVEV